MEHLKGYGRLKNPFVKSSVGVIGLPFSSMAFPISNDASMQAMFRKITSIAKCLPGHILRPNPNAAFSGGLMSGSNSPSFRNRSGLKVSGYL